jgi:hypothetical protein
LVQGNIYQVKAPEITRADLYAEEKFTARHQYHGNPLAPTAFFPTA